MSSKRKRMDSEADRALLSKLIKEAQKEIRADGEMAGGKVKVFFDRIAADLTDPQLSVGKARIAAGLKGNYSGRFFDLTGMHPKEYIDYKRMKLAQKVLQRVDVYVYAVAFVVGFTEQGSFTRTYGRLLGHTPREEPKMESPNAEYETSDPRLALNSAEINTAHASQQITIFWNAIQQMNSGDISGYLLTHVDMLEVDHFRFLLEKAKYIGRTEREKGEDLVPKQALKKPSAAIAQLSDFLGTSMSLYSLEYAKGSFLKDNPETNTRFLPRTNVEIGHDSPIIHQRDKLRHATSSGSPEISWQFRPGIS